MTIHVQNNTEKTRYEARRDGDLLGFAAYIRTPDSVVFTHTEIDPEYEGQGVGGSLVRGALDDVRAQGLLALPTCPFVKAWMDRHPDYADLDYRSAKRTGSD